MDAGGEVAQLADRLLGVGERAVDQLARARRDRTRSARARAAARSSARPAAAARRRAGRGRAAGARRRRPRPAARGTRAAPPAAPAARPPAARSRSRAPRRPPRRAAAPGVSHRHRVVDRARRRGGLRARSRSRTRPGPGSAAGRPVAVDVAACRAASRRPPASGSPSASASASRTPRGSLREALDHAPDGRGAEEARAHEPEQERPRDQRERSRRRGSGTPRRGRRRTTFAIDERRGRARGSPRRAAAPAPSRGAGQRLEVRQRYSRTMTLPTIAKSNEQRLDQAEDQPTGLDVGDQPRVLVDVAALVARRERAAPGSARAGDVADRDDPASPAALDATRREREQQVDQRGPAQRVHQPGRAPAAPAYRRTASRSAPTRTPTMHHQLAGGVVRPAQPGERADADEAPDQDDADVEHGRPPGREVDGVRRLDQQPRCRSRGRRRLRRRR